MARQSNAAVDLDCGERRSSPRVALEVEVSLTSEAYFYAGLTGDVGAGGDDRERIDQLCSARSPIYYDVDH